MREVRIARDLYPSRKSGAFRPGRISPFEPHLLDCGKTLADGDGKIDTPMTACYYPPDIDPHDHKRCALAEPGLFKSTARDDAFHPDSDPGFFEWWYFDGLLDDGSSFVSLWTVNGIDSPGAVELSVHDPAGKRLQVQARFPSSQTSAAADHCDVRMGDNCVAGEPSATEIHFHHGDMGCDLKLRSVVQGVRFPPDGAIPFASEPRRFLGWTVAQPRAEVSGRLIVGGRETAVSGVGYHDHNWGVGSSINQAREAGLITSNDIWEELMAALSGLYDYWYWGRLFLPGHTIVYSIGKMAESVGHNPAKSLIVFKGEELVSVSTRLDVEEKGMTVDSASGLSYPQELVIKLEHRRIRGEAALKLRRFIETKYYGRRGHAYLRFLADCHVRMDCDGQMVDTKTTVVHELMKP